MLTKEQDKQLENKVIELLGDRFDKNLIELALIMASAGVGATNWEIYLNRFSYALVSLQNL